MCCYNRYISLLSAPLFLFLLLQTRCVSPSPLTQNPVWFSQVLCKREIPKYLFSLDLLALLLIIRYLSFISLTAVDSSNG